MHGIMTVKYPNISQYLSLSSSTFTIAFGLDHTMISQQALRVQLDNTVKRSNTKPNPKKGAILPLDPILIIQDLTLTFITEFLSR